MLDGLSRQTYTNIEIIIADDGSGPDTEAVIARWAADSSAPVLHSWQEDDGFRAARSRNLAISRASGDYVVMLDGDGLIFPTFIENHVRHAETGWFTAGKRCFLNRWAAKLVMDNRWRAHLWPRTALFPLALFGASNRALQLLSLPVSPARRKGGPERWDKVQTCNLGVWRSDIDRIAGFDEGFSTYGLEDSDFVIRLIRAGVKRLALDHADPVLHLWHPRRTIPDDNVAMLDEVMSAERIAPRRSLLSDA